MYFSNILEFVRISDVSLSFILSIIIISVNSKTKKTFFIYMLHSNVFFVFWIF